MGKGMNSLFQKIASGQVKSVFTPEQEQRIRELIDEDRKAAYERWVTNIKVSARHSQAREQ